jgi:RNA polymerase sigma-70 factor (ECF subfamily)
MTGPDTEMEPIVARVLEGDLDAFAAIIRRYQQDVWRIAAFALRDVGATEDLTQQVFVNVYLNLKSYQRGRDLGAWIRTIARNQVRKEIRDAQRSEHKLRRYHQWLMTSLDRVGEPDDRSQELREALSRCREQLAPRTEEALKLRYEQALPFDRIADALGRTVAATRQLLSRARAALRQCVEKRMAHT